MNLALSTPPAGACERDPQPAPWPGPWALLLWALVLLATLFSYYVYVVNEQVLRAERLRLAEQTLPCAQARQADAAAAGLAGVAGAVLADALPCQRPAPRPSTAW